MPMKMQINTFNIFYFTSRNQQNETCSIEKKRFNSFVLFLHGECWISIIEAEKAEKQYKSLIKNADFLLEAKKFNINDDRVDNFYYKIFDSSNSIDLESVVRLILMLSHGNARVEAGFPIDANILSPNMLEESIITQRIVGPPAVAGRVLQIRVCLPILLSVLLSVRAFSLNCVINFF